MYGRMQFADYIVGYALQANTDCLQRLLDGAELSGKDIRQLRRNSERLQALWQMMHWSVGKAPYRAGIHRLEEVQQLLPLGARWIDRAAAQLLAKVDDQKTTDAVEAARQGVLDLQTSPLDPAGGVLDLDRLNCLFQDESECWRDYALLRKVQDYDLIEHGVGRAYGKSRRLGERLLEQPHNSKRLRRTDRWVRHSINHLELLRPALSQSNKARAWFLDRLGANLEKQLSVMQFCASARSLKLKPKVRARVERLAENRCRRLAGQTAKLVAGAFQDSDEAFIRAVADDVKKLGLQEIVLLPVDGLKVNNETG